MTEMFVPIGSPAYGPLDKIGPVGLDRLTSPCLATG
jgi:hypothetical protein